MKSKGSKGYKKRFGLVVITIAIIIFTIPLISSNSLGITNSSEVLIAFDESHDQFCNFNNYQGNYLLSLLLLNATTRYEVKIIQNGSMITPFELIGVDILIIGNPGINATFNETEINTIASFVVTGGNLLLMSEGYVDHLYPLNQSQPNTSELNRILRAIGIGQVARFTNQTIRDESELLYYYVGKRYQIPIPQSSFMPQSPVGIGIDMVLTFASHIDINPLLFSNNIIATGRTLDMGNFVLPLSSAGSDTFLPIWLAGFELFSNSRVLLCGSTMMFSDLIQSGNSRDINLTLFNNSLAFTLTTPWYFAQDITDYGAFFGFPSFDNAKLWMNMFDWLTVSENETFLPYIIAFLAGIIGIFGVAFSLLIYARKRKIIETKIEIIEKEKEILPTLLERAETLKQARQSLRKGSVLKAIELYQKASKLSSKLSDEQMRRQFNQKARDLRSKKLK